ncbi:ABC transporter permease [Amycolatopsis jiangsuensis]|uniref:Peptide/nickel transport system permease protein n=1 Tax=Amycolatopsis jiangsuensis TaxID=1181879 RepID=A0A840IP33_9PSEU|nr:ABC transporter permease [Amycolatopsis jiangsuensis]MBB4684116.1 peptide/nickel transport system permease protein [Amycolatopsis jiangsuensis]
MLTRFALRRLVLGAGQVLLLLVLVFGLSLLLPGDAADARAGEWFSEQQRTQTRQLLGLDLAPVTRFLRWLGHVLTGDLGTSYAGGEPVARVIGEPFAVTGLMAALTTLVLLPVAGCAGFAAGLRPGSVRDRVITTVSVVLDSIPDFVLSVLAVAYLAVRLRLFPATFLGVDLSGMLAEPGYLVLPLTVMVARVAAPIVRLVRAGVIDVLDQPYIRQARRFGVGRASLLLRHVAPNALGPALQELGRTGDGLLSGVLIVEAVFALPGIASTLIEAIGDRDQPVILAIVLITGVVAIAVNTLIDLAGQRMVPRRGRS